MKRLEAYRDWWRPLPVWLKLVTTVCIYPAWFFIVYCVFTGASESQEAFLAFGVFMAGTLLHIAFDRRNRGDCREPDGIDYLGRE
ncbi:MAG: hypothetical protein EOO81_12640 [Oxalobacteraceae bacterium]|nr:MAG: hypothetical protein EOO81_12640 [Oxalobacteraceae bacterium]